MHMHARKATISSSDNLILKIEIYFMWYFKFTLSNISLCQNAGNNFVVLMFSRHNFVDLNISSSLLCLLENLTFFNAEINAGLKYRVAMLNVSVSLIAIPLSSTRTSW